MSPPCSHFPPRQRAFCLAVLLASCSTNAARADDPTAEQQYWLEIINRMRMDPAAELEKLVNFSAPGVWGSPKSDDTHVAAALNFFGTSALELASQWSTLTAAPPLAWSSGLSNSAITYSNLMVTMDQQSHTLDGQGIADRLTGGGYSLQWLELGENLFAMTQSVDHGHAGFAIDWGDGNGAAAGFGSGIQSPPGHRELLMDAVIKELGIGYQSIAIPGGNVTATGPLVVTQHFGTAYRESAGSYFADAILTGVIYADTLQADNFYTPGEGWSGVSILVYDDLTDALVTSGLSNSAGGFSISLAGLTDGVIYRVEAPGTGLSGQTFMLDATVLDYGAPVTFYDNVYAAFQVVPEPDSALLFVTTILAAGAPRRRLSLVT